MLELVKKLPSKNHRFHEWYMKNSLGGQEMFGMLMRPQNFALASEKVVLPQFKDIYEVYQLDTLNIDLLMAWCVSCIFSYVY
jgi:hypothetical protein